ncbi:MerC domain-containing protein [Sphingomonas sp.]|uniref:MerC domain-containing protein n=1 Tax=Sphingomonas sp. TaxID=28214 RepID=UPI002D804F76|nr:MerC domain-containing protein [Sphingomonas sp.]HEU0044619.1 MerC domain-containing protein [Sphingomonas sp.]
MTTLIRQPWSGGLDRLAIGLSGLCVVHCIATSVALALMSAAGGLFFSHLFHEIGLTLAIILGIVALGRGALEHGYMMPAAVGSFGIGMMAGALALPHDGTEALWTVLGVGVLAFGHDLNYRATH